MENYSISDLERWAEKIFCKAEELGLDCYPQEFELCDHAQMLGYMAYSGLPAHYPHWSYGKSYEKLKTMYDYGVSGLPYEMVINSDPCLAYLMRDNSLLLQILTMAHVYGHNDFFKNNFTFRSTSPEFVLEEFKTRANRIRGYIEDPGIGIDRVEKVLDAAQALSFHCRRNLMSPSMSEDQHVERVLSRFKLDRDPNPQLKTRQGINQEEVEKALEKVPLEPDEDLLLFVRDHRRHLSEWEKDILTVVDEEARNFIPQIETKIMNEGWASYWHKEILESLNLPTELHLEFIVRHSQVLAPASGGLNPYHLGYEIWNRLRIWYDGMLDRDSLRTEDRATFDLMRRDLEERDFIYPESGVKSGHEMLFRIREADRDASFLRQFLDSALMRELNLFEHATQEKEGKPVRVVTKVADSNSWKELKDSLIQNVGMGSFPVIKVEDSSFNGEGMLFLKHYFDGREIELPSAEKTLLYVYQLWQNPVLLSTQIGGKDVQLKVDSSGEIERKTAA